ncbi:fimbrial protein [Rahnella selenatireducens]|uniref:fimbrial protein n=1 Tax=Rahnella selenatireducens TaxID=3389797 RepID=UPI0039695269
MKKGLMAVTIMSVLAAASVNATASDGTISFTGSVTDTACAMDIGATNELTVAMGSVAKTAFTGVGSTASATEFDIKVKDCPATAKTATVKFDGTTYSGDNAVLALDTPETGTAATGVGIQIKDSAQKVVPLFTASSSYTLAEGANTLPFVASYIQKEATVVSGVANATAQFTLNYN